MDRRYLTIRKTIELGVGVRTEKAIGLRGLAAEETRSASVTLP